MRERFVWMLAIVLQDEDRDERNIQVEENSCRYSVAVRGCRLEGVGMIMIGREYEGFEIVYI